MEKRIELERRARKTCQITDLNLDNCRSTSIVGLTDEYTALESLSLINVGLTTLKGFPKLPNLKKLELSDNRISNGLHYLHTSPKLQYLNLSGNKIKDLEALKPLKEFTHLAILDLFNNEATQVENYREKIFELLPSLKYLDGFDSNDVEAPSDGDDEEENLNYSDDDDGQKNVFNLNGLEIDLDELEEFEKRVKAKREAKLKQQQLDNISNTTDQVPSSQIPTSETTNESNKTEAAVEAEVDELDEYLKNLKLKEQQKESKTLDSQTTQAGANFVLLLYWFLAILNLASATFSNPESDDNDGDEEENDSFGSGDDVEGDADEDDFNDVSLSEVYNDDLEEDEDDWDEGNAVENDDDDEDDSDEGETPASNNYIAGEEPQGRGKKRKHEG